MFNMTQNEISRKTDLQLNALFQAAARASVQPPTANAAKAKRLMAMIQAELQLRR